MKFSDKYSLSKRLGSKKKRKFGEIFIGTRKFDGQKIILKALKKNDASKIALDRLRNEAGFTFEDDRLPQIIDFFESDEEILLVRKFVPGIPLNEFRKLIRRRDLNQFVLRFTDELIPILDLLKNENIVHCDLKPGNILIKGNIDSFSVHLIDFGLALRADSPEERPLLFPLGYAAPELLLNHLNLVDHTTDLFSIGIILWQLYADQLPLSNPNPSIFTNLQLTHPLPDHSALPKGLIAILNKTSKKHTFDLPPNKMPENAVKLVLKLAMQQRYRDLRELKTDLIKIIGRKRFRFLPTNIFPIP